MPVDPSDRQIVEALFRAMQAGPDGEEALMSLFATDAVLVEPFTGQVQTHEGKAAIRRAYAAQWEQPDPDLSLNLDRLDLDGEGLRAEWTCTSPHFPTPMRGYDLFRIRAGKIARLEIVVTDMPPMSEEGP